MTMPFTRMLMATAAALSITVSVAQAAPTMRVDYYHTGTATTETFSLDRIVIEPLEWPGHPEKPIDRTNLGKYFFEVQDPNGRVLYSRGFASIYGEWETTGEATKMARTFHESLRFPTPEGRVRIVIRKRDAANQFRDVWTIGIDPKDLFVDPSTPGSPGPLLTIEQNGDPRTRVDFLIMGDGYTAAERGKFERDARRMMEVLFSRSPFRERRRDFNIWGIVPAAIESGVSRPSTGTYRASPLGATYDAFGSERYILTFENRKLREAAAFAPYEFIEILTNTRTYGGGGIFGQYGTVAVDSEQAPYVFVHEFAHHFAALADEYYTSPVAYAPATARVEPWEPNVTALLDPKALKWRDLVSPGTPLPTPWQKAEFERVSRAYQERRAKLRADNRPEEDMEALFAEVRAFEVKFFAREPHAGKVGAFEGANYEATGFYRPEVDCIMFTRHDAFCAVCRKAIEAVIALYAGA